MNFFLKKKRKNLFFLDTGWTWKGPLYMSQQSCSKNILWIANTWMSGHIIPRPLSWPPGLLVPENTASGKAPCGGLSVTPPPHVQNLCVNPCNLWTVYGKKIKLKKWLRKGSRDGGITWTGCKCNHMYFWEGGSWDLHTYRSQCAQRQQLQWCGHKPRGAAAPEAARAGTDSPWASEEDTVLPASWSRCSDVVFRLFCFVLVFVGFVLLTSRFEENKFRLF